MAVCRLIDVHRGRLRGGPINLIGCLGRSQQISLGGASHGVPYYTVERKQEKTRKTAIEKDYAYIRTATEN